MCLDSQSLQAVQFYTFQQKCVQSHRHFLSPKCTRMCNKTEKCTGACAYAFTPQPLYTRASSHPPFKTALGLLLTRGFCLQKGSLSPFSQFWTCHFTLPHLHIHLLSLCSPCLGTDWELSTSLSSSQNHPLAQEHQKVRQPLLNTWKRRQRRGFRLPSYS